MHPSRWGLVLGLLVGCGDVSPEAPPGASTTTGTTGTTTSEAPTTTTETSDSATDGTTGTGGIETTGAPDDPIIAFACPGAEPIVAGVNSIQVGDRTRTFIVDFPTSPARPLGVLFSWHGFGDNAENFRAAAGLLPDGDPSAPVIVVTPEDAGLPPPVGLDWDIAAGTEADENIDIAFFEAMLGCLNEQEDIDPARIASFGFSAGSVMTSLLHSRHPQVLGTIIAASGAWFNDPAQQELVNVFDIPWNWPPLEPMDGGAVLLTHGGPNDATVLGILNLEDAAQAAFPFLAAGGRVVVGCAHAQGHTLHPEVTPAMISAFLSAHRTGEPSPYIADEPTGFPASCSLRLP